MKSYYKTLKIKNTTTSIVIGVFWYNEIKLVYNDIKFK